MSKKIRWQVFIFSILMVITLLAGNTFAGTPRFADSLPVIYGGYTYEHTNEAVVHVNKALAEGYLEVEQLGDLYLSPDSFNIACNVLTDFSRNAVSPDIAATTFVHPLASVMGNVALKGYNMLSPFASVRGDEGQPIYVCEGANIQDGVILHALETEEENLETHEFEYLENRRFNAQGERVEPDDPNGFAIFIGEDVSLAHQAQIHGPAYIGDHTFIGMQSLIFNAKVGSHSVVEPGCIIIGVEIGNRVYVPAGSVITSQAIADVLPAIYEGYLYEHTNEAVVHVNKALAEGYLEAEQLGDLYLSPDHFNITRNVLTDFSRKAVSPDIAATTFVHPFASVMGNVALKGYNMLSPFASVRGDEGQPIYVCEGANIQDGVILHALETEEEDPETHEFEYLENRRFNAQGERVEPDDPNGFAIFIGEDVSLAHQAQIHGPAYIGDHTFIGMQSLIFNAKVGSHSVVEPGCVIIGVEIGNRVYVPAGSVITSQAIADVLPAIYEGYLYEHTNEAVVHVNKALAEGYLEAEQLGDLYFVSNRFNITRNVLTDFSRKAVSPDIAATTFVHLLASVMGNVTLKGYNMLSPFASVRGDEGQPEYVHEGANIQDGVILHALETEEEDPETHEFEYLENRRFNAQGERVEPDDPNGFAIFIGEDVSLAHQAQIHGPAYIGDHTFIGMQSLIFNAKVGSHSVVEPGCIIIGVEIGNHVYVPAGSIITNQAEADVYHAFTHGFWKNHYPGAPSGHNAWQYTGFETGQMLGDVFNFLSCEPAVNALFDVTFLKALSFKGGSSTLGAARILIRDAVASLLNASYYETRNKDIYGPDGVINFPYYSTYVVDLVNATIMSCNRQTMLSLADHLGQINNGLEDIIWDTKEPKPPKGPKGLSISHMAILTGNYGRLYSSSLFQTNIANPWFTPGLGISNMGRNFSMNQGWQATRISTLSQVSPWTNAGKGGVLWYQNDLDWFKMPPPGQWWWQSSLGIIGNYF